MIDFFFKRRLPTFIETLTVKFMLFFSQIEKGRRLLYRLGTVNSNTVNSKLPLNSKFQFLGYLHLLFILIVLIVCFML